MTAQLSNYRFVITGGGGGIGAATGQMAAARGATVMLGDLDADAAEATAAKIRADGGKASAARADISDPDSVQQFIGTAADFLGGIDVLVNNAGVADAMLTKTVSIDELPIEAWDRVFAVNVRGTFLCTRAAVSYLRHSEHGSVINAASVGSVTGFPHTLAYGASKAAIAMLTKNLAIELAPDGIRVNSYAPATTETQMTRNYLASSPDPEGARKAMISTHLIPRLGHVDDIAAAICFLAGPDASFINGHMLVVDGGQTSWRGHHDGTPTGSH